MPVAEATNISPGAQASRLRCPEFYLVRALRKRIDSEKRPSTSVPRGRQCPPKVFSDGRNQRNLICVLMGRIIMRCRTGKTEAKKSFHRARSHCCENESESSLAAGVCREMPIIVIFPRVVMSAAFNGNHGMMAGGDSTLG
jgi:hypothetical protein